MSIFSRATVVSIKDYGDNIKEFILKLDNYKRFEAGTFLQLTLNDVTASERWPDSRPFSIASYYNEDKTMRLIIRKVGKYTAKIFEQLKVGSICTIKYAFGEFILPMFDKENEIVCIAGGTGISPFLSFIECLEKEGGLDRIKLFYSVRTPKDYIELDYIKNVIKEENLFIYCTDEKVEWAENRRINIEDILKNTKNKETAEFYICGSSEFIADFKRELKENDAKRINTDEWQ